MPERKTGGTTTSGETEHWLNEFGLKGPGPAARKPAAEGELADEEIERLMGGGDGRGPDAR